MNGPEKILRYATEQGVLYIPILVYRVPPDDEQIGAGNLSYYLFSLALQTSAGYGLLFHEVS
jgi:Na+-transporting NADH:ubiquinone oxidoreductase subunit NqrF